MKAVVLEKPRSTFHIKDVEMPSPRGFEVLVRVRSSGLCHTDFHLWEGHYGPIRVEERGVRFPLIMGHEIAGEVADVGEFVVGYKPGDRVVVYPWIGCGFCKACLRGEENLCVYGTKPLGIVRPGGFAEYVLVPHQRYLVRIDGDLNLDKAAVATCGGITAYSAVKKAELSPGDTVMVIGVGGVGHLAVQIAKRLYGATVIAVDIKDEALEVARKLGADYIFNSAKLNIVEEVRRITNNVGADSVIDTVAHTNTVLMAFNSLKRGGKLVVIGIGGEYLNLTIPLIPLRNISIKGSYVGSIMDLIELLELLKKGFIDVVTSAYPLDRFNEIFEMFRAGKVVGRAVFKP